MSFVVPRPSARLGDLFFSGGMASRAVRATAFTGVKFGGQNALRLAGNLVLTRLLFPEAFGIMAIVQVVLAAAAMMSDIGIRSAIVQDSRGNEPAFLNTAWTLQIVRGFVLGAAIVLAAEPLARFYDAPLLASLLHVAAIVPVVQGFASTRLATASRELFLGRMVALHLGAQAAGLAVMIALALQWNSVWALMLGTLVAPALVAALSHIVLPGIKNRLCLERAALSRLFGFGKYIFLATLAGFVLGQSDKAVLGKIVPLGDLAIYNIAFFLAAVPLLLAQRLNTAVMFPLYARRPPAAAKTNRAQISRARFLMTAGLMLAVWCLALTGDALVKLLYDARYHAAGPLLILIALSVIPQIITASYANLALAAGHSGRYAVVMVSGAVLQLACLYIGARSHGMIGVILSLPAATLLHYPVLVITARRYLSWDWRHDAGFGVVAMVTAIAIALLHRQTLMPLFS